MTISDQGDRLLVCGSNKKIVYNVNSQEEIMNLTNISELTKTAINNYLMTPDGKLLLCMDDKKIYFVNINQGIIQDSFEHNLKNSIGTMTISPQSNILFFYDYNAQISWWDVPAKKIARQCFFISVDRD